MVATPIGILHWWCTTLDFTKINLSIFVMQCFTNRTTESVKYYANFACGKMSWFIDFLRHLTSKRRNEIRTSTVGSISMSLSSWGGLETMHRRQPRVSAGNGLTRSPVVSHSARNDFISGSVSLFGSVARRITIRKRWAMKSVLKVANWTAEFHFHPSVEFQSSNSVVKKLRMKSRTG